MVDNAFRAVDTTCERTDVLAVGLAVDVRIGISFFTFRPHLECVVSGLKLVDRHISATVFNVLHAFLLLQGEFSVLVEGIERDSLHLVGEGVGKLHVHVVLEVDAQLLRAVRLIVLHHSTRGHGEHHSHHSCEGLEATNYLALVVFHIV